MKTLLNKNFKLLFLALLLTAISSKADAQITTPGLALPDIDDVAANTQLKKVIPVVDSNAAVGGLDKMPEFPGDVSLYLSRNIEYPAIARKNNIRGRVVAQFVVSKYGKIINVIIKKGLSPECDAEVIRALSTMPDWKPGTKNGVPVSVYYTMPVSFN